MISEGMHIPLQPRRVTHRLLGSKRKPLTDLSQNRVAKMAGAGFGSGHESGLRGGADTKADGALSSYRGRGETEAQASLLYEN
jgi:hypothetical protein